MSEFHGQALRTVILSGGFGTRLWPLSRQAHPKQFQPLLTQHSLLQDTVLRLQGRAGLTSAGPPILVCHAEHRFLAAEQLRDVGISNPSILLEPEARGTAPALTLACLEASRSDADPVVLVMPSDHVISDRDALAHAVAIASRFAATQPTVVTFGVVPSRAETGYGYIQLGELLQPELHRTLSFVEKPPLATVQALLEEGGYVWNSGMFLMRASVWLRAIGDCRPEILAACERAMQNAVRDLDFTRPDAGALADCPADSIDYAVMERLPSLPGQGITASVVKLDAGWSDVGAWDSLAELLPADDAGNALKGDAIAQDCSNSVLFSTGRLLAGIGLKNLVVVETPDAVLVLHRDRAQDVKDLVSELKSGGRELAGSHRKVHRPWGSYDSIDRGDRFQVKRIVVKPGGSLSLQMHHHRAEHWVVVRGRALVTNGDRTYELGENESTFIARGQKHRLSNPGAVTLEVIEVQSGSYFGEDDVVRFDDVYGRPREGAAR